MSRVSWMIAAITVAGRRADPDKAPRRLPRRPNTQTESADNCARALTQDTYYSFMNRHRAIPGDPLYSITDVAASSSR